MLYQQRNIRHYQHDEYFKLLAYASEPKLVNFALVMLEKSEVDLILLRKNLLEMLIDEEQKASIKLIALDLLFKCIKSKEDFLCLFTLTTYEKNEDVTFYSMKGIG